MKKIASIFLVIVFGVFTSFSLIDDPKESVAAEPSFSFNQFTDHLYSCISDGVINRDAFGLALKGYYNLLVNNKLENTKYLTIVDMSLSSNIERLYIINMVTQQMVYSSLVAHGRNSGEEYATNFSNKQSSFQTSIGFYKTGELYEGKRGLSMKLDGLEFSNDKARQRGIVIHGADYVSEQFIKENERLGRSLGCPALPMDNYQEILDIIKEGSCFFVYYPQKYYLSMSKLANAKVNQLFTNNGFLTGLE